MGRMVRSAHSFTTLAHQITEECEMYTSSSCFSTCFEVGCLGMAEEVEGEARMQTCTEITTPFMFGGYQATTAGHGKKEGRARLLYLQPVLDIGVVTWNV